MKSFLPSLLARDERNKDVFESFNREIDRIFDQFRHGFQLPASGERINTLSPRVDVSEAEGLLEISVELPGIEEKDFDVTLSDNILTIKGEKKSEAEDDTKDYHIIERSYGSFRRSIPLPFEVDADKVTANFDNGVLKLSFPKPVELEKSVKKIEINRP